MLQYIIQGSVASIEKSVAYVRCNWK